MNNYQEDIEMLGENNEGNFVTGMFFAVLFSILLWIVGYYLVFKGGQFLLK